MPDPAEAPPAEAAQAEAPDRPTGAAPRLGFDPRSFVRQNPRLAGSAVLLVLGIVFVMLGWYGAAQTNILTEQIPYLISGGLLGLGLIIVAGFLAASSMLEQRTEQMRLDLLRALETLPTGPAATNGARASGPGAGAAVYVLSGGHSYHIAGCPVIEGKDGVSTTTPRKAIAGGLAMCKLCGPE